MFKIKAHPLHLHTLTFINECDVKWQLSICFCLWALLFKYSGHMKVIWPLLTARTTCSLDCIRWVWIFNSQNHWYVYLCIL